jgi:hypothetical protein
MNAISLERDLGLHPQICQFPINSIDKIDMLILQLVHINPSYQNIHFQKQIIVVVDFKAFGLRDTQIGEYSPTNDDIYIYIYIVYHVSFLVRNYWAT